MKCAACKKRRAAFEWEGPCAVGNKVVSLCALCDAALNLLTLVATGMPMARAERNVAAYQPALDSEAIYMRAVVMAERVLT